MTRGPGSNPSIPFPADEYDLRLFQALDHARGISDDDLLHHAAEVIVESLLNEHAAAPVVIDFDQLWVDEEKPFVRGPEGYPDVELTINFPAYGHVEALWNRGLPIMIHGQEGSPAKITFPVRLDNNQMVNLSAASLKEIVNNVSTQLRELETVVNNEIAAQRERLRREVSSVVEPRWLRLRAFRQAANVLGIPVAPRTDASLIPLQPRKVTLSLLDDALHKGSPEWRLEEEVAEDIVKTIMSFNSAIERLTATANKLAEEDEVTIRDLLLFILNAQYQGSATGETFIHRGKTDILLRWRDRDAFIGECKFWSGSAHFARSIEQLLDRYTVWRQARVALILFIRNSDVTATIEKANNCIINHGRWVMTITPEEPDRRRDYLLQTAGDDQRQVRLVLLPVVIPRPHSS